MTEQIDIQAARIFDPLPERPGPKGVTHCCAMMIGEVDRTCWHHDDVWDCPDFLVYYSAKFNEYGLPIRDGGTSYWVINHCPWCGATLPESQRSDWYAHVEHLDIDVWDGDETRLPEKYRDARWWRDR